MLLFLFSFHDTLNPSCVSGFFMCGRMAGWLAGWLREKAGRECSCRRFHSRAGREGLGALLGRAGGDNFRWNHAGVNGTLSLIAVCLICLIMLKKAVTIIPPF